jgi:hypothetical protein
MEAQVAADERHRLASLDLRAELLDPFRGVGERLLEKEVAARANDGQRLRDVEIRRGRDHDQFRAPGEAFVEAREDRLRSLRREGGAARRVGLDDCRRERTRSRGAQVAQVTGPDGPSADDEDLQGFSRTYSDFSSPIQRRSR